MIRVLQVIHSMNLGGAENFIMNIYRVIDKTKIQFDFLVNTPGTFDEEIRRMGGNIWMIPYVNKVGPFRYRSELKRFFSEHPEYQVVHSHLDTVSGEVIRCAKQAGVQRCITHSHNTATTGNMAVQLLKKYYQKKIPRYADVCLACSEQSGKWLYRNDRAIVINNGIDLKKFQFRVDIRKKVRMQYQISEQAFVIGHVGRFSKVKNHRFLVELFESYHRRHENTVLLLCGSGEEKDRVEKLVADKRLTDQVIFFDAATDVYKMYNAMDVFVFPSVFEGISLAMLEAQVNGLPIVASDSIDPKNALTDHVTFLSLDDSREAWTAAIEAAGLRGRVDGREALEMGGYDIRQCADKLVQYYQQLSGIFEDCV